jgi:Ca-activated chloride channel family protein
VLEYRAIGKQCHHSPAPSLDCPLALMTFAEPEILWWLLLVAPLLSVFLWWAWRKRQRLIAQFVRSRLLGDLTVGVSRSRQKIRLALLVGAVACVLIALARPQWGFTWEEAKQQGLDIVVAIDVSKSMLAEDLKPNRLARAKLAALDLARLTSSDRLGLIACAGSAFLQCPLTFDDDAFRQSVAALEVGIIPQGGSALAEAIDTAVGALKRDKDNFKVLVLFSDGEDHEGAVVEAAEKAVKAGLKIFTIGVGTPEGEQLRERNAQGVDTAIRDQNGQIVVSRLNEGLLREIAAKGNGFYLPLRGAKAMDVLYERGLAPLPKSELSAKQIKRYHERFQWPLALATALLLLEMFYPERQRIRKQALAAVSTNAALRKAVALILIGAWPARLDASPRSALREYEGGNYAEALREFEKLKDRHPDDPRLYFNAGAAAYQSRAYAEAARNFASAANLPESGLDLQEGAFYNLGNSLFRLGEQTTDPATRTKTWEESLKQFDAALKLNAQDTDARFNRDFVKQRLEELKKQQAQQPDKNQQQQQQQKSQSNQSANQKQPPAQKQDPEKTQPQPPTPEKSEEQKQPAKEQDQPKKEQQPKTEQKPARADDPANQEKEAGAAAAKPGEMTPQQARQLLDALKNSEQTLPIRPPENVKRQPRVVKDW